MSPIKDKEKRKAYQKAYHHEWYLRNRKKVTKRTGEYKTAKRAWKTAKEIAEAHHRWLAWQKVLKQAAALRSASSFGLKNLWGS